MELYEVFSRRRSIRRYKPDMVPREIINKILEYAMWAPSGRNWQPWEFLVVTGAKKEALAASYGRIAELTMPPAGQRTPEQEKYLEWARTLGGAPLAIVALTPVYGDPAIRKMNLESVSAAFCYLLLAATAEGLGTCWMTGPLRNESEVRQVLGIQEDREIVAITPIGYPDEEPAAPPRRGVQEKIKWIE